MRLDTLQYYSQTLKIKKYQKYQFVVHTAAAAVQIHITMGDKSPAKIPKLGKKALGDWL
jgi:hypothetical protein